MSKPWYKRWWAIALGALVVLTAVGSVLPDEEEADAEKTRAAAPSDSTPAPEKTAAATPAKPALEIVWDSPEATTKDEVTLKGTVSYGAHVRVGGQRAAVNGTRWTKVVRMRRKGENTFSVEATRKGHIPDEIDVSVTRKLSAAERAQRARRAEERRRAEEARRAERRREEAARRAGARALESAESYLEMGGFSKAGLFEQLSSSAGEGFTESEAQYAVDHVDVSWKEEAVEAAKSYLETSSFSRSGLYEQLSSSAGEGFTPEQAQYAVDRVY